MKTTRVASSMAIVLGFALAACSPTGGGHACSAIGGGGACAPAGGQSVASEATSAEARSEQTEEDGPDLSSEDPYGVAVKDYPSDPPNYPSAEPADLTIFVRDLPVDVIQGAADAYEKATGASLTVITDEDETSMAAALDKHNPDVMIGFDVYFSELLWYRGLEPIEYRGEESRFYPPVVQALSSGEQPFGVPLVFNVPFLLRNTEILAQEPQTIEDVVLSTQEQVTYPLIAEPTLAQLYSVVSSLGVVFAPSGSSVQEYADHGLDLSNSEYALNSLIADASTNGLTVTTSDTYVDMRNALIKGNAASYIVGVHTAQNIFDEAGGEDKFAISPVPRYGDEPASHMIMTTSAFVPKGTQHWEAAQDFIFNYLTTDYVLTNVAGPELPATYSANVKYSRGSKLAQAVRSLENTNSWFIVNKPEFPLEQWFDMALALATDPGEVWTLWPEVVNETDRVMRGE